MAQAQETSQAASVIAARSREEAIAAFGDGSGITALGGGTLVMPAVRARGRARRRRGAAPVSAARSREEAIAAFGDGSGITVLGGGTIVMPEIRHGRLAP